MAPSFTAPCTSRDVPQKAPTYRRKPRPTMSHSATRLARGSTRQLPPLPVITRSCTARSLPAPFWKSGRVLVLGRVRGILALRKQASMNGAGDADERKFASNCGAGGAAVRTDHHLEARRGILPLALVGSTDALPRRAEGPDTPPSREIGSTFVGSAVPSHLAHAPLSRRIRRRQE